MRSRAALLVIGLWLSSPASTAAPAESILEGIETPRDEPIAFVEKRSNALLSEPLVLSGVAEFRSDGTLVKTIESPFRERVTIARDSVEIVRDGRTRRLSLSRKDDVRDFYVALRALLEGDAETLRGLVDVTATEDGECWRLSLTPLSGPLARFVEAMVVTGRSSRVLEVRTEHPGDEWHSLALGGSP